VVVRGPIVSSVIVFGTTPELSFASSVVGFADVKYVAASRGPLGGAGIRHRLRVIFLAFLLKFFLVRLEIGNAPLITARSISSLLFVVGTSATKGRGTDGTTGFGKSIVLGASAATP